MIAVWGVRAVCGVCAVCADFRLNLFLHRSCSCRFRLRDWFGFDGGGGVGEGGGVVVGVLCVECFGVVCVCVVLGVYIVGVMCVVLGVSVGVGVVCVSEGGACLRRKTALSCCFGMKSASRLSTSQLSSLLLLLLKTAPAASSHVGSIFGSDFLLSLSCVLRFSKKRTLRSCSSAFFVTLL